VSTYRPVSSKPTPRRPGNEGTAEDDAHGGAAATISDSAGWDFLDLAHRFKLKEVMTRCRHQRVAGPDLYRIMQQLANTPNNPRGILRYGDAVGVGPMTIASQVGDEGRLMS